MQLPVISTNTIVDRLKAFAGVPQNQLDSILIHRDLSLSQKGTLEKLGSFGNLLSKTFSAAQPQFNQIEEFNSALDFLETEIRRNDFALLQDPEARAQLPKVVLNLRNYTWKCISQQDKKYDLSKKCDDIRSIILSHTPLVADNHPVPCIEERYFGEFFQSEEYLRGNVHYSIQQEFNSCIKILLDDLQKPSTGSDVRTLGNIQRLIALTNKVGNLPDTTKNAVIILLNRSIVALFELPVLVNKQTEFLDLNFKHRLLYTRQFVDNHSFKEHLRKCLNNILESYDSPLEKVKQFQRICAVERKFMEYICDLPREKKEQNFVAEKTKLLTFLLPLLPSLVADPNARIILKELFIYQTPEDETKSCLRDLVYNSANKDLGPAPQKFKNISKFHNAGLLEPEGENLRMTEGWWNVMEALVPPKEHYNFILFLFLPFVGLPKDHPKHIYHTRFLKGSSLIRFPQYFVKEAIFTKDAAQAAFLIQRMLNLQPREAASIREAMNTLVYNEGYARLQVASNKAANTTYVDVCRRMLGNYLTEYFYIIPDKEKDKTPFDYPEEVIIEALPHLNQQWLEKEGHGIVAIDLKKFPTLTRRGLAAILEKFPMIDIHNFDHKKPSPISDLTLTDGKNNAIYCPSEVLSRASEYLQILLKGSFKEFRNAGNEEKIIELPPEEFAFFERWMPVMLQPNDNFYKRILINFAELRLRLGAKPDVYLTQLSIASRYQMGSLLKLLDGIYTHLITPPVGAQDEKAIHAEVRKFRSFLTSLPRNSPFFPQLEEIKSTKFFREIT